MRKIGFSLAYRSMWFLLLCVAIIVGALIGTGHLSFLLPVLVMMGLGATLFVAGRKNTPEEDAALRAEQKEALVKIINEESYLSIYASNATVVNPGHVAEEILRELYDERT